ncbi:MAG: hypothetical protein J6C96_04910 [Oscillospiraceae bacterium]|nr:hypothetical protein [Oscillospiraceae bacterium]
MEERVFKIPEFEYFDMGGKYSGNKRGDKQDDFNFRFTPKEKLLAQVWYGINCFEKSELVSEAEFDITRDGYHAACDWVEEQFRIWHKEHTLLPKSRGYWSIPPEKGIWNKTEE